MRNPLFPSSATELHSKLPCCTPTKFITDHIVLLLSRFSILFKIDGSRIEYRLIRDKDGEDISFSMIFCINRFARQLHVSKFYPGLFRQSDCKYLSAATFFLLIHHCAEIFALDQSYSLFLQCRRNIFEEFYSSLADFSFKVIRDTNGENVDVSAPYHPSPVNTAMIIADS